jgi:hypothetical protein
LDQNRGQMSSAVLKASDGQRNFIKREMFKLRLLLFHGLTVLVFVISDPTVCVEVELADSILIICCQ